MVLGVGKWGEWNYGDCKVVLVVCVCCEYVRCGILGVVGVICKVMNVFFGISVLCLVLSSVELVLEGDN